MEPDFSVSFPSYRPKSGRIRLHAKSGMWTAGLHSAVDERYRYDAVLIGSSTVLMMEAARYSETSVINYQCPAQKPVINWGITQASISPNNIEYYTLITNLMH